MSATFGAVMSTVALDTVKQALEEATELVEVIPAGKDREFQYVLILCHRSAEETAFETLKKFGFSRSSLRGGPAPPGEHRPAGGRAAPAGGRAGGGEKAPSRPWSPTGRTSSCALTA